MIADAADAAAFSAPILRCCCHADCLPPLPAIVFDFRRFDAFFFTLLIAADMLLRYVLRSGAAQRHHAYAVATCDMSVF